MVLFRRLYESSEKGCRIMHLRRSTDRRTQRKIGVAVTACVLLGLFTAVGPSPVVAGDPVQSAGMPIRLKIPSIHVDATIEPVGLTPENLMGLPKYTDEVAWYQLGPRPGEPGNAVISGHVDSTTGAAIFWDLHKLVVGDTISVVGDNGFERQFVVTASERYATGDAPLTRIFGAADGVHLNLFTCDADTLFDRATGAYTGYLLVYADAVA